MYNRPYSVLYLLVFLSAQDVVLKECTVKVIEVEMAFLHLLLHFDMVFGSLVLKCSSNCSGGLTQTPENQISSAEELFSWLPPSGLLAVSISCLSITISVTD